MEETRLGLSLFVPENRSSFNSPLRETAFPASRIPCGCPTVSPAYLSGIDTIHISCWIDWKLSGFLDKLGSAKGEFFSRKADGSISSSTEEFSHDLEKGVSFNFHAKGAGKFSYKLTSGDLVLLFSNHRPRGRNPNCCIEVGSISCWNPGWRKVAKEMFSLIKRLGGTLLKHRVKRVDATVDLFGVDFEETDFDNYKFWISKGSKFGMNGDDNIPNYFFYGRNPMMMRAYNKGRQLETDSIKREFFHRLWESYLGYVPEYVTRVEFEVCRKTLKGFTTPINTIEDLENNINSLWLYCVGSDSEKGWARHCSRAISKVDRACGNTGRIATSDLWQLVQSVRFNEYEPVIMRKELKRKPFFNRHYVRQTCKSLMLMFAAERDLASYDYEQHIAHAGEQFVSYLEDFFKQAPPHSYNFDEYKRKVEIKRNDYESFYHGFENEYGFAVPVGTMPRGVVVRRSNSEVFA